MTTRTITVRHAPVFPLEVLIWLGGFIFLATLDPALEHPILCPLGRLGFDFCPGCGLGRSVSMLLHGDIPGSLQLHPLGIPAAFILLNRILFLLRHPVRSLPSPTPTHQAKG